MDVKLVMNRPAGRLVHHAEVLVLRGDSYRLKGKEVLQGDDRG
jgi:DNA replication protein DnaC